MKITHLTFCEAVQLQRAIGYADGVLTFCDKKFKLENIEIESIKVAIAELKKASDIIEAKGWTDENPPQS